MSVGRCPLILVGLFLGDFKRRVIFVMALWEGVDFVPSNCWNSSNVSLSHRVESRGVAPDPRWVCQGWGWAAGRQPRQPRQRQPSLDCLPATHWDMTAAWISWLRPFHVHWDSSPFQGSQQSKSWGASINNIFPPKLNAKGQNWKIAIFKGIRGASE